MMGKTRVKDLILHFTGPLLQFLNKEHYLCWLTGMLLTLNFGIKNKIENLNLFSCILI